jgi:uncharacterized lipoprotein YajG
MKASHLTVLLFVLLAVGLFTGCAARPFKPSNSFQAEGCPTAAIEVVANHLSDELAALYPPGHTTLYLHQSVDPKDTLGPAFDQALRSRGFIMAAEPRGQALTLAYVLDQIDPETWYTKLTISNGLTLTRTYQARSDSFQVEGGARTNTTEPVDGQKR